MSVGVESFCAPGWKDEDVDKAGYDLEGGFNDDGAYNYEYITTETSVRCQLDEILHAWMDWKKSTHIF